AGADHPVTRHDDPNRIAPVGKSDRARCTGRTDLCGYLSVGPGLAIRDSLQSGPYASLKLCARQCEIDIEGGEVADEVGAKLLDGIREGVVVALPACPARLIRLTDHPEVAKRAIPTGLCQQADGAVDGPKNYDAHAFSLTGQWLTGGSRVAHRGCVAYDRHGRHFML